MDCDMDLTFRTRPAGQKPIDFLGEKTLNGTGKKTRLSLVLSFIPVTAVMGRGHRCLLVKLPFQTWNGG